MMQPEAGLRLVLAPWPTLQHLQSDTCDQEVDSAISCSSGQFASASQTIGIIFHVICNNTWSDTSQGYVSLAAISNQVAVLNQCVSTATSVHLCAVLHELFCVWSLKAGTTKKPSFLTIGSSTWQLHIVDVRAGSLGSPTLCPLACRYYGIYGFNFTLLWTTYTQSSAWW
jgi:hypothetical protein